MFKCNFFIKANITSVTFGHAIKALNISKCIYSRMISFPSVWNMLCVLWWRMLSITLLSYSIRHTLTMIMLIMIVLNNMFMCIVLNNMLMIVVSSVHVSMLGLWFPSVNSFSLFYKGLCLIRLSLSVWHLRSLNFKSLRFILFRGRRCRMTWRFNKINVWRWWGGCSISISNSLSISMRFLRFKEIIQGCFPFL